MRYTFDHDYHIHSYLSSCSQDPEQTAERILRYAKDEGLRKIVITDHFWDAKAPLLNPWYAKQNLEHISKIKPLPKAEGVEFLFGCEAELSAECVLGLSKELWDEFDFIVIPTTHMHMINYPVFEDDEAQIAHRAKAWVERMYKLLSLDLPFRKIGVAHLACKLFCSRECRHLSDELYARALDEITTPELERIFSLVAQKGAGVELNLSDMTYNEITKESVLRIFRTAKEKGCKFYLGSDAHHPKAFNNAREIFERAINDLDLTENDKFHF